MEIDANAMKVVAGAQKDSSFVFWTFLEFFS